MLGALILASKTLLEAVPNIHPVTMLLMAYTVVYRKKAIFPLLDAVGPEEECYDEVRAMVKILNFVHEADVDDEIPPTSIVRDFIGGNTFYKK